ncbi:MAG: hypothetical protein ACE37F_07135 [Nannocystaceae bacterium]
MTRRLLTLATLLLAPLACGESSGEVAPIPESLRGAYGRTDVDAFLPTLGLEVDVDTLRYSELTVKVVAGKELPNGSYQVDEAELRWAKDAGSKEPKTCKGTIDRQGSRLLLTLFKMGSDAKCESSLDGEWEAWSLVDEIPESMAGSYGRKDPYAVAEGLRLEGKELIPTSGKPMTLEEAVMFESKRDHVIVRKGTFGETQCTGSIDLVDGWVSGKLEPVDDSGTHCPSVFGQRWTIETGQIPKGALSNGKVSLEVHGEAVLLKSLDEQNLKCEQAILRTANRKVTQSGRDGIPVMGGQVLVLHEAKPTSGASACADRLGGLAMAQCEEYLGVPCDEGMLSAAAHEADDVKCPSHIIIGDAEGGKRKIALLPQSLENAVCWELKEPLAAK